MQQQTVPNSVVVRVRVDKKTTERHYTNDENTGKPNVNTGIEMRTVYTTDKNDPNFIFSSLSGGTEFKLMTINQAAAALFELHGEYECVFTRVK